MKTFVLSKPGGTRREKSNKRWTSVVRSYFLVTLHIIVYTGGPFLFVYNSVIRCNKYRFLLPFTHFWMGPSSRNLQCRKRRERRFSATMATFGPRQKKTWCDDDDKILFLFLSWMMSKPLTAWRITIRKSALLLSRGLDTINYSRQERERETV